MGLLVRPETDWFGHRYWARLGPLVPSIWDWALIAFFQVYQGLFCLKFFNNQHGKPFLFACFWFTILIIISSIFRAYLFPVAHPSSQGSLRVPVPHCKINVYPIYLELVDANCDFYVDRSLYHQDNPDK